MIKCHSVICKAVATMEKHRVSQCIIGDNGALR